RKQIDFGLAGRAWLVPVYGMRLMSLLFIGRDRSQLDVDRFRHGPYSCSAASPSPSRSRSCNSLCCTSLKRDHLACHSEGCVTSFAWTAVTLYSGQLVAQSEASVVTTLAPDSGKWKVV